MKKVTAVIVFWAASLLLGLQAAAQAQPKVLGLGTPMEEVIRSFGRPARYRMGSRYYDTAPTIATGERLFDVYGRRTAENEYEIWIGYEVDASTSRLHPTLRVNQIRFLLDKPRPMKQVMEDLPEVALACLPGCHILVDAVYGDFVWLSTNPDGKGVVVSGTMEDPKTGKLVPLSTPDLSISHITVASGYTPLQSLGHDTGSVWHPAPR